MTATPTAREIRRMTERLEAAMENPDTPQRPALVAEARGMLDGIDLNVEWSAAYELEDYYAVGRSRRASSRRQDRAWALLYLAELAEDVEKASP